LLRADGAGVGIGIAVIFVGSTVPQPLRGMEIVPEAVEFTKNAMNEQRA
jgi:hypothetical protein